MMSIPQKTVASTLLLDQKFIYEKKGLGGKQKSDEFPFGVCSPKKVFFLNGVLDVTCLKKSLEKTVSAFEFASSRLDISPGSSRPDRRVAVYPSNVELVVKACETANISKSYEYLKTGTWHVSILNPGFDYLTDLLKHYGLYGEFNYHAILENKDKKKGPVAIRSLYMTFRKENISLIWLTVDHSYMDGMGAMQFYDLWTEHYKILTGENVEKELPKYVFRTQEHNDIMFGKVPTGVDIYAGDKNEKFMQSRVRSKNSTFLRNMCLTVMRRKRLQEKIIKNPSMDGAKWTFVLKREWMDDVKREVIAMGTGEYLSSFSIVNAVVMKLMVASSSVISPEVINSNTLCFPSFPLSLNGKSKDIPRTVIGNFANVSFSYDTCLTREEILSLSVAELALKYRRLVSLSGTDPTHQKFRRVIAKGAAKLNRMDMSQYGNRNNLCIYPMKDLKYKMRKTLFGKDVYARPMQFLGEDRIFTMMDEQRNYEVNAVGFEVTRLLHLKSTDDLTPSTFRELAEKYSRGITKVSKKVPKLHLELSMGTIPFYVMRIDKNDSNKFKVDFVGKLGDSFADLVRMLPERDGRYVYINESALRGEKIPCSGSGDGEEEDPVLVLLKWIPEKCGVATRVKYSFQSRLLIFQCPVRVVHEANDFDELGYEYKLGKMEQGGGNFKNEVHFKKAIYEAFFHYNPHFKTVNKLMVV